MTAFNNIKTNNWPAASNDLEDFLVLKLPLNDQASLTESLPVTAGSKVLYPKRTLTNTGVSMVGLSEVWSNFLTSEYTLTNAAKAFNGSTSDQADEWDGTYNVTRNPPYKIEFIPPSPIAFSSSVRVYSAGGPQHPYNNTISVDLGSGYGSATSVIQNNWVTVVTGSGSLTKLKAEATQNGTNIRAIEIDGQILVDSAPTKHYDDNADFGSTSEDKYLTVPASTDFSFGNDPWCIECWAYIRSTPGDGTAIWDFDTSVGYTTEEWICGYLGSGLVYFYWGSSSNYHGISTSYTANQWQHWAWTWDGTTARLFKDGTLAASSTTTNKSAGWGSATRDITIGKQNLGSRFGDQLIQDLRFYKGVAKYTANFTPPGAILD